MDSWANGLIRLDYHDCYGRMSPIRKGNLWTMQETHNGVKPPLVSCASLAYKETILGCISWEATNKEMGFKEDVKPLVEKNCTQA